MYKKNVNRNFWIDSLLFIGSGVLFLSYLAKILFGIVPDPVDYVLVGGWGISTLIYFNVWRSTAKQYRIYSYWKKNSNLVKHMEQELNLIPGLDRYHEDFFRQTIVKFAELSPSGSEAGWVTETLKRLMSFENLTPISNNLKEWVVVAEDLWQSTRNGRYFSEDAGRTYYDVDDSERSIHLSEIDPLSLDGLPEFTEFREYVEKDIQMMQKLYEERENTDD